MNILSDYNKSENKNEFLNLFESIVFILSPPKQKINEKNSKYSVKEIIVGIIEVLTSNISWKRYNGIISGTWLNKKHNEYVNAGVYEYLHEECVKIYIKEKNNKKNLSCLSTDTSFISNKNCKEIEKRNKFYKGKKGIKISTIVDKRGVPLSIDVCKGSTHDSKLFEKTFKNIPKSVKDCKYMLADKGYDSEKIREMIRKSQIKPIIPKREKKSKKNEKIKVKKPNQNSGLNESEKKIFKGRIIVENFFSWIKNFPKTNIIYEKKIKNYNGLVLLASSLIIINKM
jgi:transposase